LFPQLNAEKVSKVPAKSQCNCTTCGEINVVGWEDELIGEIDEPASTKVKVAMDSGCVANVIHPNHLPPRVVRSAEPNRTGRNFVGAGGDSIKFHGTCLSHMRDPRGHRVNCKWNMADVTRPLNSVSSVCGPEDGDGDHDVLFNNKLCVVVPAGIVNKILETVTPLTRYDREGNLYTAEMELSDFIRQGQGR